MRFRTLVSAALCFTMWQVSAAQQKEAVIFQNTIRNVDMNGSYLDFINMTGVTRMVNSLPDRAELMLGRSADPKARQVLSTIRLLLKTLNISAWKATAVSCREVASGVHLTRCFAYLGKDIDAPGFSSLPGRKNTVWPQLNSLPMDTRIALAGSLQPGEFWQNVSQACLESGDPLLSMMVMQLPQVLEMQTKIRFTDLLSSLNGPYELLIFGSVGDPCGMLTLPDSKGLLAQTLRQLFAMPPQQQEALLPVGDDLHPSFKPIIRFEQGKLVIFSSQAAAKRLGSVPPGGLLATAKFAPYFKLMPAKGIGYCIVNVDEVLRSELLALAAPDERAQVARALSGIELNLVAMAERTSDGFATRAVTNASLPEIMAVGSLISYTGTLFPVFNLVKPAAGAQNKACMGQLKQLGLGCIIYANEHEGMLPEKPEELVQAKAVKAETLCNPGKKLPYVFLGGLSLKKLSKPAATPIAFDAPGSHKEAVHVLFADGHVETIPVRNYRAPEQVIGVLNRTYRFSPEELQLLRSKLPQEK